MRALKKLIEVAIPLDDISAATAREKSIRHGHPSTLHLWWSRKPLAAARAVLWASLVDDPSSHPEKFETEDAQNQERARLFEILKRLVRWENTQDANVMAEAREEIRKSLGDDMPEFLDPFSGGGAIPFEAQRLGLQAHAHDLNPVAVMINKAMIEIPPKFSGLPPVNPSTRASLLQSHAFKGAVGLAEDIDHYGQWMKARAFERIGHLYPKVKLADGTDATVIAWIWARTVQCPNPMCRCQTPLVSGFVLSRKQKTYIQPIDKNDHFEYEIRTGDDAPPGTVGRKGGVCLHCHTPIPLDYIRPQGKQVRLSHTMIGIVAEGSRGRLYLSPNPKQLQAADCPMPDDIPNGEIEHDPRRISIHHYGLTQFGDLFTARQLTALTTLSDLVGEVYDEVLRDATAAGRADADDYAKAIATYLAFVVDKIADYNSTISSWNASGDKIGHTFSLQSIGMTWDFAESNPFSHSSGCFDNMLEWVYKCVKAFPVDICAGTAQRHDATKDCGLRNLVISTDPPYYDNINYANISDYFYIWLRRMLRRFYPDVFRAMLTPKSEQLVADAYRHQGDKVAAKSFFEDGMSEACKRIHQYASDDVPVTIYYAYKQSDASRDGKTASSGWETMLSAILRSGFAITGTWPVRTEMSSRSTAQDTNAIASSVVIVCRKRAANAPICSMRDFVKALHRELTDAIKHIQSSNIAPVDLAQSAIGPGMSIFSQFSEVLKADGTPITVREALETINQEIDCVFDAQNAAYDPETRLCLALFQQSLFAPIPFGSAEVLARAKNTSVDAIVKCGAATASKGFVSLRRCEELTDTSDKIWMITHHLVRAFYAQNGGGFKGAAQWIITFGQSSKIHDAKDLAYQLYMFCDRKKLSQLAIQYNTLVTAWPDIMKMVDASKNINKTLNL